MCLLTDPVFKLIGNVRIRKLNAQWLSGVIKNQNNIKFLLFTTPVKHCATLYQGVKSRYFLNSSYMRMPVFSKPKQNPNFKLNLYTFQMKDNFTFDNPHITEMEQCAFSSYTGEFPVHYTKWKRMGVQNVLNKESGSDRAE